MVEHRHAKQRRGEKQEIDRNPEKHQWLADRGGGGCACGRRPYQRGRYRPKPADRRD
ncbi:MAG TPA: hypothetical protein VES94_05155 [Burkholderiales bacterium]|nr:hypothetical protein [Burkholderiales bacterium]